MNEKSKGFTKLKEIAQTDEDRNNIAKLINYTWENQDKIMQANKWKKI